MCERITEIDQEKTSEIRGNDGKGIDATYVLFAGKMLPGSEDGGEDREQQRCDTEGRDKGVSMIPI